MSSRLSDGRVGDDDVLALPADRAAALARISLRRLRRWDRRGIVGPTIERSVSVRNTVRLYGHTDMMALLVAAELRQQVSLQHLRQVLDHVRKQYDRPLTELRFAVSKRRIYFQHPDGTWEDGRQPDQIVIPQVIPLEPLRARIRSVTARADDEHGRHDRRRGRLGNKPVFAGTRIPVETVRGYLANGFSVDDVIAAFPALSPEDVETVRSA